MQFFTALDRINCSEVLAFICSLTICTAFEMCVCVYICYYAGVYTCVCIHVCIGMYVHLSVYYHSANLVVGSHHA